MKILVIDEADEMLSSGLKNKCIKYFNLLMISQIDYLKHSH